MYGWPRYNPLTNHSHTLTCTDDHATIHSLITRLNHDGSWLLYASAMFTRCHHPAIHSNDCCEHLYITRREWCAFHCLIAVFSVWLWPISTATNSHCVVRSDWHTCPRTHRDRRSSRGCRTPDLDQQHKHNIRNTNIRQTRYLELTQPSKHGHFYNTM